MALLIGLAKQFLNPQQRSFTKKKYVLKRVTLKSIKIVSSSESKVSRSHKNLNFLISFQGLEKAASENCVFLSVDMKVIRKGDFTLGGM